MVTKPEFDDEADEQNPAKGPRTNPSMPTASRLKEVTLTQAASGDNGARPRTERPPLGIAARYIGSTVDGRYFVEAQLGEGGMGVVYRCRHTIIDKKVAMKVLRADMARNEEVTERFLNEARSASSIGNPHIIDISDFGRLPDGATYFVMEFLTGTPLSELAEARKALPPARAGHIAIQLTEGLAAAHDAGIIHRDLKPDNIFLVKRGSHEDFVKILDFGIAKASTTSGKLTQAGQVFGTPHYMSPEQASGSDVDHRSDIYALGVILYELTTGHLPFDADNFMAILTQHMYKAPVPPSQIKALPHEFPAGLEDLILRCMAKEPGQRYQTMSELGEELGRVFAGLLPHPSRDLRSLTDNYGSPAEFANRRSSAASIPGSQKHANIARYALIGVVAAAFAGTAVFFATRVAEPEPEPEPIVAVPHVAKEAEPQKDPEPPREEAPVLKQVTIAVSPLKAHVYLGDKDLGESPVMVEIGGEPVKVSAKLKGYIPQDLTIDGSKPKVSIELEKAKTKKTAARPAAPAPLPKAPPQPQPKQIGGGELVNPWD